MYDFIAGFDFNDSDVSSPTIGQVAVWFRLAKMLIVQLSYERISYIDIDRLELFMHYVIGLI